MHRPRLPGGLTALVLALLVAAGTASPVEAETVVRLGTHEFGHLSKPDAIVARAGAGDVAWENPAEGPANGPWSFDVAADGSIWLLDQFNYRVLVWEAGRPNHPARLVSLPQDLIRIAADLAVGPDGTIYLSYVPVSPPNERNRLMVAR